MNYLHYFYSIKFLMLIWLILIYILYLTCDKEDKLEFKDKYYDKLPSSFSPSKMKSLVNYGKLYPKDLVAEVMWLIFKDVLIVSKESNKIKLSLNKKKDLSFLTNDENYLISWLFNTAKNENEIDIRILIKPDLETLKAINFRKSFAVWNNEVNKWLQSQNLFKSKKAPLSFGIIISIFYFMLTLFLLIYIKRLSYLFLFFISIITILYALNISKRTIEGRRQYALWMAFKRYLKDIEKNEPKPNLYDMEKYLPYAVSLGVHSSVINIIKLNISDDNINNLKILNAVSIDEFEKKLDKILKSAETSIISAD